MTIIRRVPQCSYAALIACRADMCVRVDAIMHACRTESTSLYRIQQAGHCTPSLPRLVSRDMREISYKPLGIGIDQGSKCSDTVAQPFCDLIMLDQTTEGYRSIAKQTFSL